jgi:hypothetical protein
MHNFQDVVDLYIYMREKTYNLNNIVNNQIIINLFFLNSLYTIYKFKYILLKL